MERDLSQPGRTRPLRADVWAPRLPLSRVAERARLFENRVTLEFECERAQHDAVRRVRDWVPSNKSQINSTEGFDPGSERTLAVWIRHASRARKPSGE